MVLAFAAPTGDVGEFRSQLDRLIDTGQFAAAESLCREQLARTDLDERERAEALVEQSRARMRHALATTGSESDSLWHFASRAIEEFLTQTPRHPRSLVLRTQLALVGLAHGSALAEGIDVSPTADGDRRQARELLKQATKLLTSLEEETTSELRRKQPSRPIDARLRPHELGALAGQLDYEQGLALKALAEISDPATPDRSDYLNQALAQFRALAGRPTDQPLAWESRLAVVDCLCLAGDWKAAGEAIARYDNEQPPAQARLALRAADVAIAVGSGDLEGAAKLFEQGREIDGRTDAALDLSLLEAAVAIAERNEDAEIKSAWTSRAQDLARLIERERAGHAAAKARRLVARRATSSAECFDSQGLALAAQTQRQAGNIDAAIKLLDSAREQAAKVERRSEAFDFGYQAAALEQSRQNTADATRRYLDLASAFRDNPKAPDAHLMAAHLTLEQLRASQATDYAPYRALLEEHLRRWPGSSTASDARWRLGRLFEYERQWTSAIDAYRGVELKHARAADALAGTLRCYEQELQRASDEESRERVAREAGRYFERVVGFAREPVAQIAPESRHAAALAATRMWQLVPGTGSAEAKRFLSEYLRERDLTPEQRQQAQAQLLLVGVSQAGSQLAIDDAAIAVLEPQQIYDCLKLLHQQRRGLVAARRGSHATLILRLVDVAEPRFRTLTPAQQKDVRIWSALAAADSGDSSGATRQLAALEAQHPGDVAVVAAQADVAGSDASSADERIAAWRRVERASRDGSAEWFRAKLELARAYHQQGNDQQAAKIIRITELLHADLGGARMKQEFESLRKELSAPTVTQPPR